MRKTGTSQNYLSKKRHVYKVLHIVLATDSVVTLAIASIIITAVATSSSSSSSTDVEKDQNGFLLLFSPQYVLFLSVLPDFIDCLLWAQHVPNIKVNKVNSLSSRGFLLSRGHRPTLYFKSDCDKHYKVICKTPHRLSEGALTPNLRFTYGKALTGSSSYTVN